MDSEELQAGRGRYMFIGALIGFMLGGNVGVLMGHTATFAILAAIGGLLVPVCYDLERSGHRLL